jgi:hypothetical protein
MPCSLVNPCAGALCEREQDDLPNADSYVTQPLRRLLPILQVSRLFP